MAFRVRGSSVTATKLSMDAQIKKYIDAFTTNMATTISNVEATRGLVNNNSDYINGIKDEIKNYVELFTQSIVSIQTNNKTVFIDEDKEEVVPSGVKQLFISMVAGGGAGGVGDSIDGLYYSGGGGGAGGGHLKVPVKIDGDNVVKLVCKIGKGGSYNSVNGTDTVVDIYVNDSLFTTLSTTGGKGGGNGTSNSGGKGGDGYNNTYNGGVGGKGTVNLSSHVPCGGEGGSSLFYTGGRGWTYLIQDKTRCNGKWGSGGGGLIPGVSSDQVPVGGEGFVLVEYV